MNELQKLIPKIDEKGLAFLLKQSYVLVHNESVDRINQVLEATARTGKKAAAKQSGTAKGRGSETVRVEDSTSGKHFVVVLGSSRKMFSRDELRKIVAISHSGKDNAICSQQLFTWLKRNRGDVLVDVGINMKQHPLLKKLAQYLRTHYKVKK